MYPAHLRNPVVKSQPEQEGARPVWEMLGVAKGEEPHADAGSHAPPLWMVTPSFTAEAWMGSSVAASVR